MTTTGVSPAMESAAAPVDLTVEAATQPPERANPQAGQVQPPSQQQVNLDQAKVEPPNSFTQLEPGDVVSKDTAEGNAKKPQEITPPIPPSAVMGEAMETQGEKMEEMQEGKDRVPTVKTESRIYLQDGTGFYTEIHKERFVAPGMPPYEPENKIDVKDLQGNKIGSLVMNFRHQERGADGRMQPVTAKSIGEGDLSVHTLQLRYQDGGKEVRLADVEVKINPQLVEQVMFIPADMYKDRLNPMLLEPEAKEKKQEAPVPHTEKQEERKAMTAAGGRLM